MTPQQAAKACMAKIEENLFGTLQSLGLTEYGVTVLEREFTEIISQVTPPPHFEAQSPSEDFIRRWPYIGTEQLEPAALRAASEQRATCSRCGCDGTNWDHQYGCPQATHANALSDYQGGAAGSGAESLSYGYVTKSGKCVPASPSSEEYPQEIAEPQPKPWWERIFGA